MHQAAPDADVIASIEADLQSLSAERQSPRWANI
jgi:hypothetical protein